VLGRCVGYAYPWDYDGDPAAAGRAAELGLDAVALAASYERDEAVPPPRVLADGHIGGGPFRVNDAAIWVQRGAGPRCAVVR
jgi:hypothetical protein